MDFGLFFSNTIDYGFWPNFYPNTIHYGFWPNVYSNTIHFRFWPNLSSLLPSSTYLRSESVTVQYNLFCSIH